MQKEEISSELIEAECLIELTEDELFKKEDPKKYSIVCKEINKYSGFGEVAIYELDLEDGVTPSLIKALSLRSRFNPELTYFVTMKQNVSKVKFLIESSLEQDTQKRNLAVKL